MKKIVTFLSFIFFLLHLSPCSGIALELSGHIAVEGKVFVEGPTLSEQKRDAVSFSFEPELYQDWEDINLIFVPFLRLDSADTERSHYDVRELNFLWIMDRWELRVGVEKIFWGVTESQHLVDIINQTDLADSTDGEEKLGQPMVNLSFPMDWGTVDLFLLPYFRERTFPGRKGRLRSSPLVAGKRAEYESGAKEYHTDFAVRYSHAIGNWDVGVSHFRGTSREPTLRTDTDGGNVVLIPLYEQINQTGLDLQLVTNEWLWKLENIYRTGQGEENFFALTGGFEYTFNSITVGGVDIGALMEWLYDDRGNNASTPFENDIMTGIRIGFNDAAGTEGLLGIVQDYENGAKVITFETSRRLSDHWKIVLDGYLFLSQPKDDPLYSLRDDDYVMAELVYYF